MDKSRRGAANSGKVFVSDDIQSNIPNQARGAGNTRSTEHNVFPKYVSRRKIEGMNIEESKELYRMQHVDFERIASIQFCVDGAVGLPDSVTATRVTARLIDYNRCQIGEPSASSISNPDSSVSAPIFDLHAGWRANQLIPSITVVCRIDTLERPSLRPRCIGFSALKLFVDESGMQPLPDHKSHGVFLNAGQYLLPIVYGTVPAEGLLSETLMDSLPHIYDAYLSVRLFDPHMENDKSAVGNLTRGIDEALATDRDYSKFIMENSVASAVIHALPYAHESVVLPAISDVIISEIKRGIELDPGEKKVVIRQCNEWLARQFPPVVQKISAIDHRFMRKYEHRYGVYIALDMLFNMPDIPKYMKSTQRGMSQLPGKGLFRKPWDNRVALFKTYFRYLPGSNVPKKLKSDATDFVVDDASLELDFTSKEFSPVFLDEFSRTAGFELSVNACLLVVVSMVDVLTGVKYDNVNTSPYVKKKLSDADQAMTKALQRPMSRANAGAMLDAAHTEERNAIRAVQEQAFKMRGLVGMYMGHEDPDATWWGILPLMLESPYEKSNTKRTPSTARNSSSSHSNGSGDGASYLGTPRQQHQQQQQQQHQQQQQAKHPLQSAGHTKSKYGKQSMVVGNNGNNGSEYNMKAAAAAGKLSPRTREHGQSRFNMPSPGGAVGQNNWVGPETNESPPNSGQSFAHSVNNGERALHSSSPVTPFGASQKASTAAGGSRGQHTACFVNAGTHQVPLFNGLPPKDMLHSSNPMAWLISNIGHQKKEQALKSGCCGGGDAAEAAVEPNSKESKKKAARRIGPKDLMLSNGASAMVSLVDPRLRQFCHESIVRDQNPEINQETMIRILKVKASSYDKYEERMKAPDNNCFKKKFASFQYTPRKFARSRSLEVAVPPNVLHDALVQEMNSKFAAKMSES